MRGPELLLRIAGGWFGGGIALAGVGMLFLGWAFPGGRKEPASIVYTGFCWFAGVTFLGVGITMLTLVVAG